MVHSLHKHAILHEWRRPALRRGLDSIPMMPVWKSVDVMRVRCLLWTATACTDDYQNEIGLGTSHFTSERLRILCTIYLTC